jgi:hypothetical protein
LLSTIVFLSLQNHSVQPVERVSIERRDDNKRETTVAITIISILVASIVNVRIGYLILDAIWGDDDE